MCDEAAQWKRLWRDNLQIAQEAIRERDEAVAAAANVPDRTFVDDQGRRWEWCGGQPGTWAWRITSLT